MEIKWMECSVKKLFGITLILILFSTVGTAAILTVEDSGGADYMRIQDALQMPGRLEASGTHFEIIDGGYFNITFDSSEPVELILESAPEMVTMYIENVSGTPSTQITLRGFAPQTTLHKYEDNYHNHVTFTTDSNGYYSFAQDLSKKHIIFIQPRASTKFINDSISGGDCTSFGSWNVSTLTCMLTSDLTETVQIDSNGTTFDGNGHTITGSGTGSGVYLSGKSDVLIKDLNVVNFYNGIFLYSSSNNMLSNNTNVLNNGDGINLWSSSNNNMLNNNNVSNNNGGIYLYSSSNDMLDNNNVSNNKNYGISLSESSNNTLNNNNALNNGRGGGIVLASAYSGIPDISPNNNNTLMNNNVSNNNFTGIILFFSTKNTLSNNNAMSNNASGIILYYSSDNNTLNNNNASNNNYNGISLNFSSINNILTHNNASKNKNYGISLYDSSKNNIHHNNFRDNYQNAYDNLVNNSWDFGYPSGGNYWSDYSSTDGNNDGIGDTPYTIIGGGAQDRYPFMKQNGWQVSEENRRNISYIWDESSGSPLPFTWNSTIFNSFNISGTGTENLTILQTNLSASQRTIEKGNLTYTTTLHAKKLNVVAALNLTNSDDMAYKGLDEAFPGQAFENGHYYILNWNAQKYIAINRKVNKLTRIVIDQGIFEKKTLRTGESWDIGGGWALIAQSIDARASPRQVWLTLNKDGVKKDDYVVTAGATSSRPIYTYVEKSIAGETDVPVFVTYVDSIFSGKTSDLVQLKYTWAVSTTATEIKNGNVYGELEIEWSGNTLAFKNSNKSITLDSKRIINLTGNLKFNVIDNTTSLKFHPIIEPELIVAAPSVEITAGIPANIEFTVTASGSPIAGTTVNLSGAALGGGITDTNGKVTISVNASYIGKITVEAEKQGYAKGINTIQAAYSIPSDAIASWNLQENYILNLVDIDTKSYPQQARLQLLKNNKAVDDIFIYEGQKYFYNSSDITIFTATINAIFSGTQANLVELTNASQHSEGGGVDLLINSSHLFKSGNFTGIDWQLNEGYNLRMIDIDVYSYPRRVLLELLKSEILVDYALLSPGQTYAYNNSTNSKVFNFTIEAIFSGTQGNLVKLKNITQYSETNGSPLVSNEIKLYKSGNFTGVGWQLDENYELKMMDIDVRGSPRQVWFELLKDNITKEDSILSHGTSDSNYTYFYNISENTILTGKVDMIFKGETFNLVKLKEFNQKSDTDASILLNNATHTFIYGEISGINQTLFENYTLSVLGVDMNSSPQMVWLGLYKNTTAVDDKIVTEGGLFRYYNSTNSLTIYAEVYAIFPGPFSNVVMLKNVTQYSEMDGSILISNARYTFSRNGSTTGGGGSEGNGITYPSNNSVFEYGEMIMLWGNASFGAPPYTYDWTSSIDGSMGSVSKILTYSLSPGTHVITLKITDINGTSNISSKMITISAVNTSIVSGVNATGPMTWNVSNFPAFWQEGRNTSESLSVAAISGERNIGMGELYYNITRQLMPYEVYSAAGKTVDYGLDPDGNKVPSGSHYAKIGLFGRPYVTIAGKANKLAKLVLEQNETSSKTLTVGEIWNLGEGWTLMANSIDAKASPRQVWLSLSKNGIKKDDYVKVQSDVYTYYEKSFVGEPDVPVFATYVDNISSGATSDMVRLKYTWLVSGNPIILNAGDNIGVLKVIETVNTGVKMSNPDHNITLNRGSTINIAGGLRLRVNDTPTLDYLPEMGSILPESIPTPSNNNNGGSSGSGSSGGGGGGGGAPSDEEFKNIEKQESRDVDVHIGLTVYKFTTQDLLKEIGFDAKVSEGLVTAKIELLKARPKKATSDAPGSVFKYFNVVVGTSGYGSSSKLENAYIVFNVPDEWLEKNNVRSVKLMKFKDNSWIDLETEKISPGTYRAYSPGFSGFAIVGKEEGLQEIKTIPSSVNTQATEEIAVPQKETKSSINIFLIIVVFTVLILVSSAIIKRKGFKK